MFDAVSVVVVVAVAAGNGVIIPGQCFWERRAWGLTLFGVEDDFRGFWR